MGSNTSGRSGDAQWAANAPARGPVALLEVAEGMYAADALACGVATLHLGDVLADTAERHEVCQRTGLTGLGLQVLATLLSTYGLVTLDGEGVTLTDDGHRYLRSDSDDTLVPLFEPLTHRDDAQAMLRALTGAAAVTEGGPPDTSAGSDDWLSGMSDIDFARYFLRSTDSRNRVLADNLARHVEPAGRRLLDLGAGSGLYTLGLCQRHPTLTATVVDQHPVTQILEQNIRAAGLDHRVSVREADIFHDELGRGYSDVLLSNVVHDWSLAEVASLASRCYEALSPGGQILIHDAFTGTGRPESDRRVAEYSPLIMRYTAGCCHDAGLVAGLLTDAGFTSVRCTPTTAHRSLISATRQGES